jgi:acetyltransferase-like isoleucine patch superfamily enzyme
MRSLLVRMSSAIAVWRARSRGVSGLASARFAGLPIITRASGSRLEIGERFEAISWSRFQIIGVNHRVVIRTVGQNAQLRIGRDCGVSGATIVCRHSISIGDGCLLGSNVTVVDTDFHPVHDGNRRRKPMPEGLPKHSVVIGRNVFIGAGAMILKGSSIGDNCVVGAGAVVSGTVPAGTIYAGNPAIQVGVVNIPGGD